MCLFSVIIPVYNEEEYISRCLQSLIAQTMNDYEVIIVDDGSGDHSIEICKKFQSKFRYCSIISHTKNMGASAARNSGIKYATGSYIVFLDSDDTLSPYFFETLIPKIKEYNYPDILEFLMNYIEKDNCRSIQGTILNEGLYERQFLKDIFIPVHLECVRNDEYSYTLFNTLRVIRRLLITENHIMFNVNVKRWEDWSFAIQIFLCANNMVVVKMPLYNYFENKAGNRINYQPETFSFVVQSYKEIDQVVGDRYDTFSDYAVERKIIQFENCIIEIFFQEYSNDRRKQYIYNILHNDYFQKVLSFSRKETKWYSIWELLKDNMYEYVYEFLLNGIKQ
jgi:glycosyltransferase involved in cell wall biosynthesis